jgi:predicted transcriptional regulator
MKAIELKFLLKLLGHKEYQAPISKLAPSDKTTTGERDKICRELADRGIVAYSREIKRFKIDPSGKGLLKQETRDLPLTDQHLLILKACENRSITPGEVKTLAANERQSILQDLAEKGFIQVEKAQIKEVWLTDRGTEYLRDECQPAGTPTISFNLLGNYLTFLRKLMRTDKASEIALAKSTNSSNKPSDEEILQMIRDLDQEYSTNNYLPIFHLRKNLEPPLSRNELDQAIYRLWQQDKIEVSSLVESIHYTPEEIQAGIPQDSGDPLFFLEVKK